MVAVVIMTKDRGGRAGGGERRSRSQRSSRQATIVLLLQCTESGWTEQWHIDVACQDIFWVLAANNFLN
eukprot:43281-Eustigmatos_ZCMA.PRE.1